MATASTASYAVTFKVGDGGSPENFTTIAELLTIKGPGVKGEDVDVTNYDSGGWRERIMTLLDQGEIACSANWLPQNVTQNFNAGVLHRLVNRIKSNYKITFTDAGATSWVFAGYVRDFPIDTPLDKQMMVNFTIICTGQPTLA